MDEVLPGKPRYRVVRRYLWQGEKHSTLYQRLYHLAQHWEVEKMVVDSSGVGAGVCSFLRDRLGERVIPLTFNRQVKSKLGWGFLSVIDTGRFQDFRSTQSNYSEISQANPLAWQMMSEQEGLQAL